MCNGTSIFYYNNSRNCEGRKACEKRYVLNAYLAERDYYVGGHLTISLPMNRCGNEYRWMIGYCRRRNISTIVVNGMRDLADSKSEAMQMIATLCELGHTVEVIDCGTFNLKNSKSKEINEPAKATHIAKKRAKDYTPEQMATWPEWRIPVTWSMCSYVNIKAPTLERAMEIGEDKLNLIPLPTDGDYVEDSWMLSETDVESVRCLYNNNQPDMEEE